MKTNGRRICDELKRIRLEVAKANGISYEPNECSFEGECDGTCPACEAELAELTRQLKEKKDAKINGISKLKKAAVATVSMAMTACGIGKTTGDTPVMLEGDVCRPVEKVDTIPTQEELDRQLMGKPAPPMPPLPEAESPEDMPKED